MGLAWGWPPSVAGTAGGLDPSTRSPPQMRTQIDLAGPHSKRLRYLHPDAKQ